MKRWLMFLVFLAPVISYSQTAGNLRESDLPAVVKETLQREIEGYRLRSIRPQEREGKTVYAIQAQGRQSRRLNMEIGEDGTLLEKIAEIQFRMDKSRLMREKSPFTVQSLYCPEAGNPERGPKSYIMAISDVSYVGGNLLALDLYGLNETGTAFTPQADEFYQDLLDHTLYADINMMIRVFPPGSPEDIEYRRNAIRTIAGYFKGQNQILFWIEGPQSEEAAKEFKQLASDLIVAAPGADMQVVEGSANSESENAAICIRENFPAGSERNRHFLLLNTPENRKQMDAWKTQPVEKEPWVPDNSNLSPQELADGFVALFDGKTTNGWMPQSKGRQGFVVQDGSLCRTPNGGSTVTTQRFADFILRLDYQIADKGNSGVQVRTGRTYRASKCGFEVQIMGDYGRAPSDDTSGAIYSVLAPSENAGKPAGEWNSMEILCQGPHVKVILNDKVVQDINLDDHPELKYRLRDGFIILTDHWAAVAYRNIRIKKL